jgi:threonine dehydrogenase-like Zn-dependent dehydrogenase
MASAAAIIEPTDALVAMHPEEAELPGGGRVLGHQGVGIVERVGPAVTLVKPQDAVLVSCFSACGNCAFCRKYMYSYCTTGGWIRADTVDGAAARLVRIPHADTSLTLLPGAASVGRAAVLLAHRSRLQRIMAAFEPMSHTGFDSFRQSFAQRQ